MGPAKPTHGGLHLSATRVDTFKKCRRKWAFEYIAKIPYAPSPWLAFGTMFHAHAETYFRDGRLPDLSVLTRKSLTENEEAARLFLISLKHWPKYQPDYFEVEAGFQTEVPGGLFTGSVDLILLPPQVVGDHKSTSDLKWAPEADTLITWPQPVCYSYNTAKRLGWKENSCRWVYTEKVTGCTKVVQTPKISINYWEDVWQGTYVPLTTEMARLHAAQVDPLELSGASDTDYCNAYGGCQFRDRCPAYQLMRDSSLFGSFDDGVADMAQNTKNELDDLLGTEPEVTQDVGETRTEEEGADIDALFNPPARTDTPKVESKAPPVVDVKATAETTAKADAEQAAKPKKTPKGTAKRSVHVDVKADITPEASDALAAATEARTTPAPTVLPTSPAAPQQPVIPDFVGQAMAMLVHVYLTGNTGESFETISIAVRKLAEKYKDQDLIIRGAQAIVSLRMAFGD